MHTRACGAVADTVGNALCVNALSEKERNFLNSTIVTLTIAFATTSPKLDDFVFSIAVILLQLRHRLIRKQRFAYLKKLYFLIMEPSGSKHPFNHLLKELTVGDKKYKYYSLPALNDERLKKLPISIRVLLECCIRNCDEFNILHEDVSKILSWHTSSNEGAQIPFKPARVILQDLTGVPLVVDLAAMRDAVHRLGGDPQKVNPECPVDLVIDHSVQVDFAGTADALEKNMAMEFERNRERFEFLKWGQSAFQNFTIVPPGFGIVHQINLEYLGRVVMERDGYIYPDTVVGTDSHTPMINGLGVVGWGVGGIEAEAVMLGECTTMVLPQVIGFKLTGQLPKTATATDLVLTCTKMLRKRGVVDKFVEFFGPGVASLSLADRATVSNMAPQYGATIGYFPVDHKTIEYLRQTGRSEQKIALITEYLTHQGLFKDYNNAAEDPQFSGDIVELDLSAVVPCLAGPKRPHDYVELSKMKEDFTKSLTNPVGFKGYGFDEAKLKQSAKVNIQGNEYTLNHGSIVIAAITSCTNTSNPGVMLAAGLLCKNAYEKKLKIPPYIKTSLSPGSQAVSRYFELSGLTKYLDLMGFNHTGYGCMTCIGNSGDIKKQVENAIKQSDLCAASVLSGNRNFEGRVHPATRANYLASPPLVVAYALATRVDIDFEKEPLGLDGEGKEVYLRDIWPSREQVEKLASGLIKPEIYKETYAKVSHGTTRWNELKVKEGVQFHWDEKSTYIHDPPFFKSCEKAPKDVPDIKEAYLLALFGDSITTDHISPAGNISLKSPAARYLKEKGVEPKDFNTYGARRGNDEIMARGTFANIRIMNKLMKGKVGPQTIHFPDAKEYDIFDAAQQYHNEHKDLMIIGGKEYGSGSSRDWAAKGPYLLGVKAVLAESFERIHRSNLVGMGILPLQFKNNETAESLGIKGNESFSIHLHHGNLKPGQDIIIEEASGKKITVRCKLNTEVEIQYYKNGGILPYVLRKKV